MSGKKPLTQIILTFFVFILSSSLAFAQLLSQPDIRINIFWDFYSNNRLSTINAGKGYTGIAGDNDISGLVLNPATLNVNKRFQVHAEYLYKSSVPWGQNWIPNVNLNEYHPSLMAAFGYKFNDYFQTGLLYYIANSQKRDFGEIIQTNEFGQEIGRYNAYDQISISSITLPLVVNYKNKFKAGINLLYTFYHGNAHYGHDIISGEVVEGKANFGKFNAQFGAVVSPIKDFAIGATFTPKVKQNVVWEFTNGTSDAFTEANVFPMKIGIGAEYRFRRIPLKLGFDYNYTNTSQQQGLNDRNDFIAAQNMHC